MSTTKDNGKSNLYDIWNQVPVTYYQKGVSKNILQKLWHGKKIELACKIINDVKFDNCLDVGCASGYMVSRIQKKYPHAKYFGVDIYDKAIAYAKSKYSNVNFKIASAQNLPFEDESIDLVTCYETIEHVEDPFLTLKDIKRILKKNGILILAMDSGSWLFRIVWFLWENSTGKVWKGSHLHPFHHSELEETIIKSGFKIKKKIFSHWGMEVTFLLQK